MIPLTLLAGSGRLPNVRFWPKAVDPEETIAALLSLRKADSADGRSTGFLQPPNGAIGSTVNSSGSPREVDPIHEPQAFSFAVVGRSAED